MKSEMWNLKEASLALGVGRETLRKAIANGDLTAHTAIANGGKTYFVDPDEAATWHRSRLGTWGGLGAPKVPVGSQIASSVSDLPSLGSLGTNSVGASGTLASILGKLGDPDSVSLGDLGTVDQDEAQALGAPSVPLAVHLRTLDLLEAAQAVAELARQGTESAHAMAERERLAKEREREAKEREQRRAEMLFVELNSYRRVLAEQAESLLEERAKRLTAELSAEKSNRLEQPPEAISMHELSAKQKGHLGSKLKRFFFG